MEIVSKISRGTKMDQVYLPKIRNGMPPGSYVIIRPLNLQSKKQAPIFYKIKDLEPIKLSLIEQIFNLIDSKIEAKNIIITGSFLEKGFNFNDIDIVIIRDNELNEKQIKYELESQLKIKVHIITLSNKALARGISIDPIYQTMLSKYVSKKRLILNYEKKLHYKLLDLSLLKSHALIYSFELLNGKEKYNLTRNLITVSKYIKDMNVDKEKVDKEIEKTFNVKVDELKQNMVERQEFLKKFKLIYNETFKKILEGIKYESKQKQTN